jgi:hypothetical protein
MIIVTGDAPQPGEMPRDEGGPFSYTDPNTAWWRGDTEHESREALAETAAARPRHPRRSPPTGTAGSATRRPPAYRGAEPAFAPEALDAHAAGVQDATQSLDLPPAARVEAEQEDTIETVEAAAAARALSDLRAAGTAPPTRAETAEPEPVRRDHDRRSGVRRPGPGARPQTQTEQGDAMSRADETAEEPATVPKPGATGIPPEGVPEIMVLAEPQRDPSRDRPTAALDRRSVPGQAPSGPGRVRPPTTGSNSEAARQRMENSPFWLTDEERAAAGAAWPAPETGSRPANASDAADHRGRPPAKPPRTPRKPVPGLIGLVALGLIAAFFSWVSAEPFWLAVGHGDIGTVTVSQCVGSGVTQRCTGSFEASDGTFTVRHVALLGVDADARITGTTAQARMVSKDSRQAYVGTTGPLVHLRWTLGFILVLLCGYGIAGMTGARQLETARARRGAVLISLAGPVLLLAGFLIGAY